MDITRRTLLKAFAAAPFVAVPGIVFAAAPRMPTVDEVLTMGKSFDMQYAATDFELKNLFAECASALRVQYDACKNVLDADKGHGTWFDSTEGAWWNIQANNVMEFGLEYAQPVLTIAFAKVALTDYNLPITPGRMPSFDQFHADCGKLVMDDVAEHSGNSLKQIGEDMQEIIANNPNCATPGYWRTAKVKADNIAANSVTKARDDMSTLAAERAVKLGKIRNAALNKDLPGQSWSLPGRDYPIV